MHLVLITGGARAGKSRFAERRANALAGDGVTMIATARPGDDEMRARIARHRAERPAGWTTIEAPRAVGEAIQQASGSVLVLDCLTVLLGNVLGDTQPTCEAAALKAMAQETDAILTASNRREGILIVVTNEVGLGVHPPTALGRWFRDGLGQANQRLGEVAQEVVFLVSGLELQLK